MIVVYNDCGLYKIHFKEINIKNGVYNYDVDYVINVTKMRN